MPLSPYPGRESLSLSNNGIINPKAIPKEIRPELLKLLRQYYDAVVANGPTPSEASQTTTRAHSIASTGTSMTEMTSTFSVADEILAVERQVVPLEPVPRARKALMRKLGACEEDCRARKVKCPLWHHKLHDLLLDSDNSADASLVEWALQFDAESPQHPIRSTRVASFVAGEPSGVRHEAFNQATTAFGVSPAPPLLYGSSIQETNDSLLDPSLALSPRPRLRPDPIDENAVSPSPFSTEKSTRMFPIGTRDGQLGHFYFNCEYPHCMYASNSQNLLAHFEHAHFRFERLLDPFRIECTTCARFYALPSADCCLNVGPSMVERLYGRYVSSTPILNYPINAGPIPSERSSLGISNSFAMSYLPYSGNSSFLGYIGHIDGHDHSHGHNSYGSIKSDARMGSTNRPYSSTSFGSMKALFFRKSSQFIPFLSFLFGKTRQLARSRRYTVVFTTAVVTSILFGHDWVLSKLVQHPGAASSMSNLNLPFVGLCFMSIAFALHRFAMQAHRSSGAIAGSWLSRCTMKLFNMACGQPTEPGQLAHELGHSIS